MSNKLGYGYQERYYQKAIASYLRDCGIIFKEQVPMMLVLDGKNIASGVADFLIEDKIILEIKKGNRFLKYNIDQLLSYLKIMNLKLGILANFTTRGLEFKRIINIKNN